MSDLIKTIIIDDEADARASVRIIIESFTDKLEIVAEAASVEHSIEIINKHKPQLVFLDIDLEDGSAFDLLQKLEQPDFKIIFVTGFNDLAVKAFRFNALDYILKPINPDELIEATEKAIQTINDNNLQIQLRNLLEQKKSNKQKNIILTTLEDIHVVEIESIIHCESSGSYTTFFLNTGEKIMVSKNIKEYADLLSEHNFFRTHQSHLININYLQKYHKKDGGYIIMKDNSNIPLSKRKKEALLKLISNI